MPISIHAARKSDDVPSLRSLEDLKGHIDLEKVVNLATLYELGIDTSNDEHYARMGTWHPSATGMCKRAQVLQFIRTPPTDEHPPELKIIFEMGHMIHDMVQTRLEKLTDKVREAGSHYEFVREVPFDPKTDALYLDFGITGTADGILRIWNQFFEQRGIVEVKSQSDDFHKKLKLLPKAWPKHLLQSHLYAYRFDCPIIWVFYINKNTGKHLLRQQLFEQEIFDAALNYHSECADFVARGELPPREEDYIMCKGCVYRTMCKPEVLARRSKYPTVPKVGLRRR